MKDKLTIIKVGGKIVEEPESLGNLLRDFASIDGFKLLVHGGGRSATRLASELGVETRMIDGRRITDDAMLRIVTMVYGGLVNKTVVAQLQSMGLDAIGLTGADLNIIRSHKRPVKDIDYGWVGDVDEVNSKMLEGLLKIGAVPVIAPLTHDKSGHLLNTNADTMAGETARAMASLFDVTLVYCFEKPGVLMDENNDDSVIPFIDRAAFAGLVGSGVVNGGMIPKIENALQAVDAGVKEVIITRADSLGNLNAGTHVR
ncbi:MAG: acetylglutamate kinase [Bacteroides sp.]|nr:acetylglutamate kinase [Bacteroides sp.]